MTYLNTQEQLNNLLLNACENDDYNKAEQAIHDGADVNASEEYGITALFHAARFSPRITQLLLDNGVNWTQTDDNRDTALYWACDEAREMIERHEEKLFATLKTILKQHGISSKSSLFNSSVLKKFVETQDHYGDTEENLDHQEIEIVNHYDHDEDDAEIRDNFEEDSIEDCVEKEAERYMDAQAVYYTDNYSYNAELDTYEFTPMDTSIPSDFVEYYCSSYSFPSH